MLEKLAVVSNQETTIDGLLNRKIMLEQPAEGYRVAVDTVLLAAAVPASAGDKVIDLGCGVGGAMLCLANRVPGISALGIEMQDPLRLLCRDNIMRNKLKGNLSVQAGDATRLSPALAGIFEQAIMNPPYHEEARHDVSENVQKRMANSEKPGELVLWLANAMRALRPAGYVTIIHRADRLKEILAHLTPHFGAIEIYKIMPKTGAEPKRIIVRARKGVPGFVPRTHEFILHKAAGSYTDAAEAILRDGKELPGTPVNTEFDILKTQHLS